jgi:hypothetical protein
MLKPTIRLGWLIVLLIGLSACTSSQRPVVVIEGAEETEAAATAFYATETATTGVTAQPTSTAVPYVRPTDDPDVSPDRVIASVAGHDITVAEFRTGFASSAGSRWRLCARSRKSPGWRRSTSATRTIP